MQKYQLKVSELYEAGHTLAWPYLSKVTYPWEILSEIKNLIMEIGEGLDKEKYDNPLEGVWIAKSAKVYPTAFIGAPCIIGENTEVRHGAFIRGNALVGDNCVVGNSVELKNVIISDNVQVPHYNYVGDSVLGYRSHMGAGSITSNVKSDKTLVSVKSPEGVIETGLKKFGAMVGDYVEVGCNSVLNPGTVIGCHSNIYPTTSVRGVVPSDSIVKSGKGAEIIEKN
ncbi:MAG: UDP-N-acetylglucosamine pyrophosphorylase [Lachnospiraceae bacterium]|nr:UDP-N-acetylglucosamine pyrophosphorylase [Lachnospiraceae bacterium]